MATGDERPVRAAADARDRAPARRVGAVSIIAGNGPARQVTSLASPTSGVEDAEDADQAVMPRDPGARRVAR